ncbi:MAG: glycosyltransferase family 2 protein [Candidatus Omnitrophota bacterium]
MIYLLLPAYNEAENIVPLLHSASAVAREANISLQTVVVNDGSEDATGERAQSCPCSAHAAIVLEHETNRGLAAALNTGLDYILEHCGDNDLVIMMDADNTHSPKYIPAIAERLETGCDIVAASRYAPGGKEWGVSFFRKLLSHGARRMYRFFFPQVPLRDFSCGYRGFRASTLRKTKAAWGERLFEAPGFSCTGELLLKALANTTLDRVTEIPFELHYECKGGRSKMPALRTVLGTLSLIWRARKWIGESARRPSSHSS